MNNIEFYHNFCESVLQNYKGPEILNSYSSLFISLIPIFMGLPQLINFKNVGYMLILNGFFSFYYHYSLSWLGKHLDEVTMILANYYGISGLIKFYDNNYQNKINRLNTIFLPCFISFNTIPQLDFLFPTIFGIYVSYTVYLIYDISRIYYNSKTIISYLMYSLFGAVCWSISELYCTEETKYGHVLWHMLFPYGFYKILLIYDDIINSSPFQS